MTEKGYILKWTKRLAALLLLIGFGANITPAFAHGEAELTVSPTAVSAGDSITVTADGVEAGETFTITLEGVSYQTTLGEVTVSGDGFEQDFVIPDDTPSGNYQVRATSGEGEVIVAELSVVAGLAGPTGGTPAEPSAAPMQLERPKDGLQRAGILAVILASAGLGLVLLRGGKPE